MPAYHSVLTIQVLFFILMWTILKVFIECVTLLLVFCFGFLACGILAPRPGMKPTPPALEGHVLTTGPPRKSLFMVLTNVF